MHLTIVVVLLVSTYSVWKLVAGWTMLGTKNHGRGLDGFQLEYSDGSTESAGDLVRREARKDLVKGLMALLTVAVILIGLIAG